MNNSKLKPQNYILPTILMAAIGVFVFSPKIPTRGAADGKTQPPSDPFTPCDKESLVKKKLDFYFKGTDFKYHLFKTSGAKLAKQMLSKNGIDLPFLNAKNDIVVIHQNNGKLNYNAVEVAVKTTSGKPLSKVTKNTTHIQFDCGGKNPNCGNLTLMGKNDSEFEMAVVNKEVGVAGIESVNSLLRMLSGNNETIDANCGISYNVASLGPITEFIDALPRENEVDPIVRENRLSEFVIPMEARIAEKRRRGELFVKEIPIVLDADSVFYEQEKESVWARQVAIIQGVNLIYGVIEPMSGKLFDIEFSIRAQEAWSDGAGPTTLDPLKLLEDINAEDYQMVNGLERDELSYFFLGYDVTGGFAGYAYRSCTGTPEWDINTLGGDAPHQILHAWGQQVPDVDVPGNSYPFATFLGRMVVASHEIGHMLGADHSDGLNNDCAGGDLPTTCGGTIMKSGAAGGVAPDFRQPFFSQKTDERIVSCVFRDDEF